MRGNWAIARDSLLNSQKLMAKAADAGRALPEHGQFGGMALHLSKALDAIARRDRGLRSRR